MLKKLRGGFLLGLGYMLSPLSWWNDLFFNFPIAYAVGGLVNLVCPGTLIAATVAGYWLSNVIGFILMQVGAGDALFGDTCSAQENQRPRNLKKDLLVSLGTSTLYTVAVVALLQFHILETPHFLLSQP